MYGKLNNNQLKNVHYIVSIILQVSLLDEADNSEDEGSVKEDNKKRSGRILKFDYL